MIHTAAIDAGQAFLDVFDPSFHLFGKIQPVILGIPLGAPKHDVELIIDKGGLAFGFDTSVVDIARQLADHMLPFLGGATVGLMSLGFEDSLGLTVELPMSGVVNSLFTGSDLPTIDPLSGNWAIELRGGMRFLDLDIGQMTGLVISAGNQTFLDAHVQKLFPNHDVPLDPSRIPIQSQERYDDILRYGGILLTGRILAPKLLTDPVDLLTSLNLDVPSNPLDMPAWISNIGGHLGETASPASVQIFLPGFGSILNTNFDATNENQRVGFNAAGQSLADKANAIFQSAYLEGTVDGTILSIPTTNATVAADPAGVTITGRIPLLGVDASFLLDKNTVIGAHGESVELPRAAADFSVDGAKIGQLLSGLGLPNVFTPAGNAATGHVRLLSPGYAPTSPIAFERTGGLQVSAHLRIAALGIDDAKLHVLPLAQRRLRCACRRRAARLRRVLDHERDRGHQQGRWCADSEPRWHRQPPGVDDPRPRNARRRPDRDPHPRHAQSDDRRLRADQRDVHTLAVGGHHAAHRPRIVELPRQHLGGRRNGRPRPVRHHRDSHRDRRSELRARLRLGPTQGRARSSPSITTVGE